jgi:hypothetical protein
MGELYGFSVGRKRTGWPASPQGSEVAGDGHVLHAGMGRLRLWDGLHALQVVLVMASRLRQNETCPIHRSKYCCGRESTNARLPQSQFVSIRKIEDPAHPRGYRVLCSDGELRKRKLKLLETQRDCFYCHEPFADFREVELCHLISKQNGGGRRDDDWTNLTLGHTSCNRKNGSKSYRGAQ